ncbi:MAG: RHS repeat-associated core domain-containing protein [Bacteroidota bacterium]
MFTTNPKTIDFTLNYESNSADPDDETLFDNLQNVIAADIHDRVDAGNESFNHNQVQLLNGATDGVVGSVLTIPVGPGDKVSAEVYAKYLAPTGTNNPAAAVGNLVLGAITGSTGGANYEGAITSGYGSGGTVTNLINTNASSTEPMAFINVLFLPDDGTNTIESSHFAFKQVSSASSNSHAILALDEPFEAPEAGYVVVYLSNESAQLTEVYFDDLEVTVNEHAVIQTSDYYPFGLQHEGGYQRITAKQNDFLYNGKELQDELDLGWLDYWARMYMPDIGRWNGVDFLADKYHDLSPYNYVGNMPIVAYDPDGMRIAIVGDEKYRSQVLYHILSLAFKSEKGAELVMSAIKSERTIVFANSREEFDPETAGLDQQDHEVVPFNLSNVEGEYDAENGGVPKNAMTVMAHELSHFSRKDKGFLLTEDGYSSRVRADEVAAVEDENIVRKELGLPQRTKYGGRNVYGQEIEESKYERYYSLRKKKNYAQVPFGTKQRTGFNNFRYNGLSIEETRREVYYYHGRYLEKILKTPVSSTQLILYEKKKE